MDFNTMIAVLKVLLCRESCKILTVAFPPQVQKVQDQGSWCACYIGFVPFPDRPSSRRCRSP